ncbi:hypothetical protein OQI89_14695 [Lentilactobacillus diolivorans]|uniref:hypothetical protein n=1 Tax=Lentilactobacillus diolivorans TaxID=179838 RepID=UPI002468960A|nr:hypothetical protein [Lentilactobacillus diolivorans]MDH5107080.1 hypothetical protein [Lentilactobacillus diolivorans]
MKKRIVLAATGLMAAGFLGAITVTYPAHAAYYRWTQTKLYSPSVPYHAKYSGTIYLWNAHHTRVVHNLKHYPRTTWYKTEAVKMTSGYKSRIYYKVLSGNQKHAGYIWRGYLTPGVNPNAAGSGTTPSTSTGSSSGSTSGSSDTSGSSTTANDGVIYSNVSAADAKKIDTSEYDTDISTYRHKAPYLSGLESYDAYAKVPTQSQIQTVVNFIKKRNQELGINNMGVVDNNAQGWQNFRIVMRSVDTNGTGPKVPFVEYMYYDLEDIGTGYERGEPEWYRAGTFQAFYDAATATTVKQAPKSTNFDHPFPYVVYAGLSYELPSQSLLCNYQGIYYGDRLYLKPGSQYTVFQDGDRLCYVRTANILDFSNGPIVKNGIQYDDIDPARDSSKLDPNKGKVYREITENYSFDEYHYENGKWQKVFSVRLNYGEELTDKKSISISVSFYDANGRTTQAPGSEASPQKLPVDLTFPSKNYDANYLSILYLPDSDFQRYEVNGSK